MTGGHSYGNTIRAQVGSRIVFRTSFMNNSNTAAKLIYAEYNQISPPPITPYIGHEYNYNNYTVHRQMDDHWINKFVFDLNSEDSRLRMLLIGDLEPNNYTWLNGMSFYIPEDYNTPSFSLVLKSIYGKCPEQCSLYGDLIATVEVDVKPKILSAILVPSAITNEDIKNITIMIDVVDGTKNDTIYAQISLPENGTNNITAPCSAYEAQKWICTQDSIKIQKGLRSGKKNINISVSDANSNEQIQSIPLLVFSDSLPIIPFINTSKNILSDISPFDKTTLSFKPDNIEDDCKIEFRIERGGSGEPESGYLLQDWRIATTTKATIKYDIFSKDLLDGLNEIYVYIKNKKGISYNVTTLKLDRKIPTTNFSTYGIAGPNTLKLFFTIPEKQYLTGFPCEYELITFKDDCKTIIDTTTWGESSFSFIQNLISNKQYCFGLRTRDSTYNTSQFVYKKITTGAKQVFDINATEGYAIKQGHYVDLTWTNSGQNGLRIEQFKDDDCNGENVLFDKTVFQNGSSNPDQPLRATNLTPGTCYVYEFSSYNSDKRLNSKDKSKILIQTSH